MSSKAGPGASRPRSGCTSVPGFPTWPASLRAAELAVRAGVDFVEFPVIGAAEWSDRTGATIAEALTTMVRTPRDDRRFGEWLTRLPVRVAVVYASAWPEVARWQVPLSAVTGSTAILLEGSVPDLDVRTTAAAELGLPVVGTADITTDSLDAAEEAGLHSAGGFVYAAMGRRTGAEAEPPALGKLDRIRAIRPDLPICCAFGIRDAKQIAEVRESTGCDGVIVGTAALDVLATGLDPYAAWLTRPGRRGALVRLNRRAPIQTVVLATATDSACLTESDEAARFAGLRDRLGDIGVEITAAWNLLGKYDYLLILEVGPAAEDAVAAMSLIAQSGTMRTESMIAIPLERYFGIAERVAPTA